MWDLVVFATDPVPDAGICFRVSYLPRRLRVRKALTPASSNPSFCNPWSSPARSYMFCVSMLISSYVLRRLTYFWCENRDERETFKGVPTGDRRNFANAYGRSSAGAPPHSRPARARAHPGSPPRANCTPGHPTATDCVVASPLACAELGKVLNTQLADLPVC